MGNTARLSFVQSSGFVTINKIKIWLFSIERVRQIKEVFFYVQIKKKYVDNLCTFTFDFCM